MLHCSLFLWDVTKLDHSRFCSTCKQLCISGFQFWRQETELQWKNPWDEHTIENVTYAVEITKLIPDNSIFSKTVLQPVFTSLAVNASILVGAAVCRVQFELRRDLLTLRWVSSNSLTAFIDFNVFSIFTRWKNNTNLVLSFFRLSVPLICGSEEFKSLGSFRNLSIKIDFLS